MAALLNGKSVDSSVVSSDSNEGEGKAEGRFFLKDKLCALGLATVSILNCR